MSRNRFDFSRTDRVRKSIMREVGDILLKDIIDERLPRERVSVMDIDVSGDLQHAKIYVSIFSDDEAEKVAAMDALEEHTPRVRYEIGKRIRLRFTPAIKFYRDDSLERGTRVTELLNKIKADEPALDENEAADDTEDA